MGPARRCRRRGPGRRAPRVTTPPSCAGARSRSRCDRTPCCRSSSSSPLRSNALLSVELELADARSGEPVTSAAVALSAFMPDHGHGTNLEPRTTELGDGRYLVEGLLLHMGGFWELHVDVVRGGIASRVTFELEL
ncbi:MAG: FixH family protein [Planctomycetota bacterium]